MAEIIDVLKQLAPGELREVCLRLGERYTLLPGSDFLEKAVSLTERYSTSQRSQQLLSAIGKTRPDLKDEIFACMLPSASGLGVVVSAAGRVRVTTQQGTAMGSVFLVSGHGHFLTAAHVVTAAMRTCEIHLPYEAPQSANVVLVDDDHDVAVLRCPKLERRPVPPLSPDHQATPGENVLVVGFPYGDVLGPEPTVTAGVISATRDAGNTLQIDPPINPGNSGGPVALNQTGAIVGVVRSRLEPSGHPAPGIGFATHLRVVAHLLKQGQYNPALQGIDF